MSDYYVALHGAKKNVGDFLIRDRAKRILRHLRPDRKLVELPSWEPLDNDLELVNGSKALVIMGGPGVIDQIYPRHFPLTRKLSDIRVPIYTMGVGSYIAPPLKRNLNHFHLSEQSKAFFESAVIGTRDLLSKTLLERLVDPRETVRMVGCPAWYDLPCLDKPLTTPGDGALRLLLSAPQRLQLFSQFDSLIQRIERLLPTARICIAFNRGYMKDQYTSESEARFLTKHFQKYSSCGYSVYDLAGNLAAFEQLANNDLHIGYRLHSHIFFIGKRKPSYIIAEDSRSFGHYETLSLPGFEAFDSQALANFIPICIDDLIAKYSPNLFSFRMTPYSGLPGTLEAKLKFDLENDFVSFAGLPDKLDCLYHNQMMPFVQSFP